MTTLNDEVRSVVESFMKSGELFTALDVSNKVKLALPFARHSEVRDVVRSMFTTDLEPNGWARSPINVTLPNGRTETALLYHLLTDSWDLDNKYDAQKRAQAALRPGVNHSNVTPGPSVAAQAAGVATPSIPGLPTPVRPTPMPKVVPATPAPAQPTRSLWQQLFSSAPSLFPRK